MLMPGRTRCWVGMPIHMRIADAIRYKKNEYFVCTEKRVEDEILWTHIYGSGEFDPELEERWHTMRLD